MFPNSRKLGKNLLKNYISITFQKYYIFRQLVFTKHSLQELLWIFSQKFEEKIAWKITSYCFRQFCAIIFKNILQIGTKQSTLQSLPLELFLPVSSKMFLSQSLSLSQTLSPSLPLSHFSVYLNLTPLWPLEKMNKWLRILNKLKKNRFLQCRIHFLSRIFISTKNSHGHMRGWSEEREREREREREWKCVGDREQETPCVCVYVCVNVYGCVSEREYTRERKRDAERERGRKRESVCVCACVRA